MTDAPATRMSIRLPAELASGPAARRFAVAQLPGLDDDDRDTLALLVAEVVTNALLHARSSVEVSLLLRGEPNHAEVLRVEVDDDDPTLPSKHDHGEGASTGRGMHLIDALSQVWGVTPRAGGKTVWFELALAPRAHPS